MDCTRISALLRKISFFEGLEDQTLEFIAKVGEGVNVVPGSVIFREGDAGDRMYLIIKGKVEIYRSDESGYETVLATLDSADVFGEMSLLDDAPRSASAKAVEETIMISLKRTEFQLFLENNFSVALKLLATLSRKLRDTNEKLAERKRRGYFPEV